MKENRIAKSIQIIGYIEVAAAFILGIFLDIDEIFGIDAFPFLTICAAINCIIFEGFAEIIELIYKNGKKQDVIIELLKERPKNGNIAPKSVLQDIESNLPKM